MTRLQLARLRRKRWKRLASAALVAAGATATVAIAQTASVMGSGGAPVQQVQTCSRFAAISVAAGHGIRQGRVDIDASRRPLVVGILKGVAVRMTLDGSGGTCRIVSIDTL